MERQAATEALARLVDHLLAHAADHDDLDHLVAALDIVQHICWGHVQLMDIPEPVWMDATAKAMAACVAERLAEVYSSPPHNHRQVAPAWCVNVAPSPVEVWLVNREFAEGVMSNSIFRRRNIVALENFLAFV
jgi:hypothetical protein